MSKMKVHFSSATDDWATPQEFFDKMNDKYGPFDLDVCATRDNSKCGNFFTPEDDGLSQDDWTFYDFTERELGTDVRLFGEQPACWMNPPYGRGIGKWVQKAYEESLKGSLVVCLLPARTDTKWFHDYCTKGEIEFIKGRLKFGNAKNAAPFPSMVVVFRPKGER